MITKCIVMWATILNNFSIGITPSIYEMTDIKDCEQVMPKSCLQYAQDLVEHFDEENIETAVKVIWCESRNNPKAYRWDNNDSGLFQILPRSWGWVYEYYDVPLWDYPMYGTYAQFVPKYNIEVAAILVEDIHSRSNYLKPWDSSKWCWEDTDKWTAKWKQELNQ